MTLPSFVVIGTAKGGTTALYWYLAEHPDVFMSPVKETNFFAWNLDADGKLLYGDPDVHRFPVKTLEEYEALYAEAGAAKAIGEASPLYLESPQAAGRIRSLLPDARIVCTLRHPVDRAYSDYLMYIRRRGRPFDPARDLTPGAPWARPDSRWMQVSRYHAQLARYYQVFPRERIHVLLFDDIRKSAVGAAQGVYRFLGVDPDFEPDTATPHAAGGVPTSHLLEGLLTRSSLSTALRRWVPVGAAKWVRRLRARTLKKATPLPPALRQELTGYFRDDIASTSKLIGRSLEHWL
ncbi:MAG TPA: sulfotransferase [Gemmatimonadales bacterium]|nr:sulfotransferase [Gemmatimonadales bacterium]